MNNQELGRVTNPDVLDQEPGARGRLKITVPSAWLAEPCDLSLVVPVHLVCARCEGGGCDGCDRSGAVRAPRDKAARTIDAHLPRADKRGFVLRIPRPFGAGSTVEQLFVEVRAGDAPSEGVHRQAAPPAPRYPDSPLAVPFALAVVFVMALSVVLNFYYR